VENNHIYVCQLVEWLICVSWSNDLFVTVWRMVYLWQLVEWFSCASWSNDLFVPVGPMVYLCQLVQRLNCASWSNGLFVPVGPMVYLCQLVQWFIWSLKHVFCLCISEVCEFKGEQYSQGQQWFDGCDYKCVCDDAESGYYTCSQRYHSLYLYSSRSSR